MHDIIKIGLIIAVIATYIALMCWAGDKSVLDKYTCTATAIINNKATCIKYELLEKSNLNLTIKGE